MNNADPLAQLRDIHLPEAVAWWPPAIGWWLLAILLMAGLLALCWWLLKRYRATAYRRQARNELETVFATWQADGDTTHFLQAINGVLKRVALQSFRRERVARLSGGAWFEFLDAQYTGPGFGELGISDVSYRADTPDCDPAQVYRVSMEWVRQHRSEAC